MPFVTTFHPGVKKLKQILMQNGVLFKISHYSKLSSKQPIIFYKRGKSLKDMLVRAKIRRLI